MDDIKQRIIKLVNDDNYIPLKRAELAIKLNIQSNEIDGFYKLLSEMMDDSYLILTKKDRIISPCIALPTFFDGIYKSLISSLSD